MNFLKILVLCLFISVVQAKEFQNINYFEGTVGSIVNNTNGTRTMDTGYNFDFTTFNDLSFDKFSITSTIYFSKYSKTYSTSCSEEIKAGYFIELEELILSYYLDKSNVLSGGLASFKKGSLSNYSKIALDQSEVLYTLYYLTEPGIFYTHYIENGKIRIGYLKKLSDKIIAENRYDQTSVGTNTKFLVISKSFLNNNLKIIFNGSITNLKYLNLATKKSSDFGKLYLSGIGVSYDQQNYSLYGILGISSSKLDGRSLTPGHITLVTPDLSFTNEKQKNGWSSLIGIKKINYIPKIKKDVFYGFEYFHASKYWLSAVSDKFNLDSYPRGLIGNIYKQYDGISLNPKLKVSLNFEYYDLNYHRLVGGNSVKPINTKMYRSFLRIDYLF